MLCLCSGLSAGTMSELTGGVFTMRVGGRVKDLAKKPFKITTIKLTTTKTFDE